MQVRLPLGVSLHVAPPSRLCTHTGEPTDERMIAKRRPSGSFTGAASSSAGSLARKPPAFSRSFAESAWRFVQRYLMRMSCTGGLSSSMFSNCQNSILQPWRSSYGALPWREQPTKYLPFSPRRSGRCQLHQLGGMWSSAGSASMRSVNGTSFGALHVSPSSSENAPNIMPQCGPRLVVCWFQRQ